MEKWDTGMMGGRRNLTGRVSNDQNLPERDIVWILEFRSLGFVKYFED